MENPEQQLAELRRQIDAADEAVAALLIQRIEVVRKVAALKAEHWPSNCHIRPGREGKMHLAIAARFQGTPFPVRAALAIWRQLIGASTHLESPLQVTTLAAHPEHGALAREYFGVQIGSQMAANLEDALKHIQSGKSNVLILPDPTQHDWWKSAEHIRAAGLSIFAALPVVKTDAPSAVALAALAPEDSGEDVSYHVENGKLVVRDGFIADSGGVFLGAHPKPMVLGN